MENTRGSFFYNNKKYTWETTFSNEIKFKCRNSGLCCMATNVELLKEDIVRLKEATNKEFSQNFTNPLTKMPSFRIMDSDKKDCLFLFENKCEVYMHRPYSCRLFPFKLVFYDNRKVFIDLMYGCKSISCREYDERDNIDYNGMIKNELELISKMGLYPNATEEILEFINLNKPSFIFSKNIIRKVIGYLNKLKTLNDAYYFLSVLQALRLKLKNKGKEDDLFNLGIEFYRQNGINIKFDNKDIDGFLKSVFFKAVDLDKNLRFRVQISDNAYFHYVNGDGFTLPIEMIDKIDCNLNLEIKEEVQRYLLNIIDRKSTEIAFYKELKRYNDKADIFIVYSELWKYMIKHINSLILINSLKNSNKITINNVRETIMMYDNVALHAPSIFSPRILKNG